MTAPALVFLRCGWVLVSAAQIMVLFALLRDQRAGLIVAVTISLSMLGAVWVMDGRGAPGNLISLGAIDFGLVADGAVISVETAVRRLSEARQARGRDLSADKRLDVVRDATIEDRGAAVFGEAIIAIVYLSILALQGIEGTLFQPMALTVLYTLGMTFVLSLTLILVLCSLFLRLSAHGHDLHGWAAFSGRMHACCRAVRPAAAGHRGHRWPEHGHTADPAAVPHRVCADRQICGLEAGPT